MIELYHNDMSVCAQKVRFTLGEKVLPWTSHHLNLRAGDQQKPEFVKLNSFGTNESRVRSQKQSRCQRKKRPHGSAR